MTVNTTGGTPTLTSTTAAPPPISAAPAPTPSPSATWSAAGQNTSDLTATAVNLNCATITDGAGNAVNLSISGLAQSGPQIDTTTPVISSIVESPLNGDLNAGKTVILTLTLSEAVTVTGGTPTLTLDDGGTATYTGGSGSTALTFSYTVAAGQNTPDLTTTAVNLNGATIKDGAGNVASLSLSGLQQGSPQIDTTTPVINSIVESPSSGDLNAGKTVKLTLNFSEAVTVAGGTPTMTLNDGGIASYSGGSGSDSLTFSYTVQAGQNTSDLRATAVNLNGAAIQDGAGNVASLSLGSLSQSGPDIDTSAPGQPRITGFAREKRRTIELAGTAATDSTVTIYDNGTPIGSTRANAAGNWSYTTGRMRAGAALFSATATDVAGTSPQSMQSQFLLGASEQLQSSHRAAFAFDFPTLGYSPSGSQQGATALFSEGNQSGVLALFGNYMASSFVVKGNGAGTVIIAEAHVGNHSLLASPHRT